MKKYLLAIWISVCVLTVAAFAADSALFPAPHTGEDGITRWGYLNESGTQQVGYFYAAAQPFNEYGFAVVQNAQGQIGVIDGTGKAIIECREAPRAVEFAENAIAYRYAEKSIYFDETGAITGEYEGAAGFFDSGLLRVQQGERWGYVNMAGEPVIPATYRAAGDFSDGRAIAQDEDGSYSVLMADGKRAGLPGEPTELKIGPHSLVVIRAEGEIRLYSLATGAYLTEGYDAIEINDDGYVSVQRDKKWGILSANGKVSVAPEYYYLSYMGEGAYAVRGAEGAAVRAIEGSGASIYATDTYVGGFETFRFGLSWHGTMDGGTMFFNKNGVLSRKLEGASNPMILSENVVRVTIGSSVQYIRLSDGKVLYAPVRSYTLQNGVKVSTKLYEKYLGMREGAEYGWRLEYPQFSEMKDRAVQTKINTAIEKFFLDGPNMPAQRESLVGSYGIAFHGSVLVVNVEAKLGQGEGSTTWNDSIALHFGTGAQYSVVGDLFRKKYEDTIIAALPQGTPFYLYSYPRMTADSVIYYLHTAETADKPATTQEFRLFYSQIWDAVNVEGECYSALSASVAPPEPEKMPADVPEEHWARTYVEAAYERGLMQGAGGYFRPEEPILASEAVVVLARASRLPQGTLPELGDTWYAAEYGGAYEAGLLVALDTLDPEQPLLRADAMQLLANTLRRGERYEPLPEETVKTLLEPFSDAIELLPVRREAAAYCVTHKIIEGTDGRLRPNGTLTRAQFAKLLTFVE